MAPIRGLFPARKLQRPLADPLLEGVFCLKSRQNTGELLRGEVLPLGALESRRVAEFHCAGDAVSLAPVDPVQLYGYTGVRAAGGPLLQASQNL